MEEPPDDEGPFRPVPESGRREHDQQIGEVPELGDPVAAERDVEVFLEPRRKGNVPAPPEF